MNSDGASKALARCRVAILGTRGIPAHYGGFETFAEQLSVRLVRRGFDVTVYAEAESEGVAAYLYQGVHVQPMPVPRWGAASVIAYDALCLWHARRQFDLVYMLGYGAAFLCWIPRVYGTLVWINVDGLEWARSKWGRVARLYLRCMEWFATKTANRLIADARAIADRFRQTYPEGAPCNYIAYGADVEQEVDADSVALLQWGLAPHRYMLIVARPEPENHVLEIIQGYLLHGGDWPLVVVGEVTDATPYQRQLLSMASEKVRFFGGIYAAAQLRSLRLHAGCYLHGHSVGGTNPSLLEAMACGNWVIAHDNPFNREVARDAADYFQTPAQLAKCLNFFVNVDATTLAKRRHEVRQIVAADYTWNQIADDYEALMEAECLI